MITFEIDKAHFMIYQSYSFWVGTFILDNKRYRLEHSYITPEEVEDELKKMYFRIKAKDNYAYKLK